MNELKQNAIWTDFFFFLDMRKNGFMLITHILVS